MKRKFLVFPGLVTALLAIFPAAGSAADSWPGVDQTVVQKFAEKAGRPARDPYINTDQGDLLLFVFLVAGIVGGFVMGYYFRALFPPRKAAAPSAAAADAAGSGAGSGSGS